MLCGIDGWATEVVHRTAIRTDLDRAHRNSQKVQFLRDKLVKLTYLAEDKGFEPSTGFPAPDFESGS